MSDSIVAHDSVLLETILFSVIRLGYFFACRQYVNISLFSNLRSVIREDGGSNDLDSPDGELVELEDAENGYFGSRNGAPNGTGIDSKQREAGQTTALSPAAATRRPSAVGKGEGAAGRKVEGSTTRAQLYTKLSTGLFCLSFSESCMLFTLLLFGEAISERYVSLFLPSFFALNMADLQSLYQCKSVQLVAQSTRSTLSHRLHHSTRALPPPHLSNKDDFRTNSPPHPHSFLYLSLLVLSIRSYGRIKSCCRGISLNRCVFVCQEFKWLAKLTDLAIDPFRFRQYTSVSYLCSWSRPHRISIWRRSCQYGLGSL